jgi:adenine-specific DNA-methyltransferase
LEQPPGGGRQLLVMNSLLQKESMAGQVQMIYIDPPYGIKYGSNFQPFVNKRDVKDRKDEDLTQEPEMIKAFRDTWELGIHSYLTYLRDRLLLAKELLHESGSVFVQISDENLHHVREIMDEVFGAGKSKIQSTAACLGCYSGNDKKRKRISELIPEGAKPFLGGPMTSETASESTTFKFTFQARELSVRKGGWKTGETGMQRLIRADRLKLTKEFVNYKMFVDDFPAFVLTNLWSDTMGTAEQDKSYVVQTNQGNRTLPPDDH